MVFLDAIHFHVRSEGQLVKKAVYIAIGINGDGRKDVLGMWVGENESAKFLATVLNGLRNRGVEDILIACADNLTGFSSAIEAVFPKTEIQLHYSPDPEYHKIRFLQGFERLGGRPQGKKCGSG